MRIPATAFGFFTHGAMTVALLALACAVAPLPAQEFYRSVDSQGHVDEPNPAEVARLAHEQELLSADEAARTRQQALDDKNKATQQRKKQQACEKARTEYSHMKESARLYQRDATGNRVYYTDDQADVLREQARRAMVATCGS